MATYIIFFSFIAIKVGSSLEANFYGTNGSTSSAVRSENGSDSEVAPPPNDCYETKHPLFCDCSLPVVLLPEDYRNESGILHVQGFNASYNISFYRIHDLDKGHVIVCEPDDNDSALENDKDTQRRLVPLSYITGIGLGVSMLGMFIHLVFFSLVRDLRNMPGCNLACLCISMFSAYASFLTGSSETIRKTSATCVATAAVTQFFMLSTFLWMNVISLDIFRCLWNSTSKLKLVSTSFSCKRFAVRCLFCCGISVVFVVSTLIVDMAAGVPLQYRPLFARRSCWFNQLTAIWIFFIAPAFVSIGINVVVFGLCAYVIFSNRVKTDDPKKGGTTRKHLMMYSKLALMTGMLWLSGIMARVSDNIVLWYFFALLNVLQGFFIFLAFTFTPNVRKYLVINVLHKFRKHSVVSSTSKAKTSSNNGTFSESQI